MPSIHDGRCLVRTGLASLGSPVTSHRTGSARALPNAVVTLSVPSPGLGAAAAPFPSVHAGLKMSLVWGEAARKAAVAPNNARVVASEGLCRVLSVSPRDRFVAIHLLLTHVPTCTSKSTSPLLSAECTRGTRAPLGSARPHPTLDILGGVRVLNPHQRLCVLCPSLIPGFGKPSQASCLLCKCPVSPLKDGELRDVKTICV